MDKGLQLEVDSPALRPEAQGRAAELVAKMDAQSAKFYTPSGSGQMIWRRWGSGPPLLMFHGGAGAWSHWIRNIGPLSEHYTVWAPDTPGLGESATPEPADMDTICETVRHGAAQLIAGDSIHVIGFSMGGPIAASLAASLGPRLCNLVLTASRFVRGFQRSYPELESLRRLAHPLERLAVHRRNLQHVMIAHAESIDALAVYIQSVNTARRRVKRMNRGTKLLECLEQVRAGA